MPFSVALVHHLLGSLRLELGCVFRPLYFKFSISAEHLRCLLIWGNAIQHPTYGVRIRVDTGFQISGFKPVLFSSKDLKMAQ